MQTIKSADTPVCESKVKLAWGRDKITLVPQKNLNAIMPKDLKQSNIVVETDVPEELRAPLSPDEPVGTASVYYVEDGKEKQLVATADLVPVILLIVYVIAAKIHRAQLKRNRKVKRYRNF